MVDGGEGGAGSSGGDGGDGGARLSTWGHAALALFAVHIVLLFLPRIPPDVKGSLWNYLAAYGAVVLGLVELRRHTAGLRAAWARFSRARRWAIGGFALLAALAHAGAVWAVAPALFERFSGEEGLWEPVTVFLYLGCALWLFGAAREVGPQRKHWQLVGAAYALLGLEEIDYFGIFGGLIGRVHGFYTGSLHDLIRLALAGVLPLFAWGAMGAVVLAVGVLLWRTSYLRPRALASMIFSADVAWALLGMGALGYAALVEIPPLGWRGPGPTPEEALELVGSVSLVLFALQTWAEASARRLP